MCICARAKNECVSRRRKRILSLVSQCSTDATCSHHGMYTVCTRIPLRLIYAWRTYPFTERLCDRLRYSYMCCSPIRNRPRGAAASSPSSRHWASCMVDIRFVHVFLMHVAINVVSTFLLTPCSPRHFPPFACCVPSARCLLLLVVSMCVPLLRLAVGVEAADTTTTTTSTTTTD